MARTILGLSLAFLIVACSRPRVTYEYEPTQTITSTDAPPAAAPADAPPSTSTTLPPTPPRKWERRKNW